MEIFGKNVFNQDVMREKLPKAVYKNLKKTIDEGLPLDPSIADVVATAMKDWAIERGATHFTHWFQPMTGVTAEKHDSFITPTDNGILMEFSGKELIKGEPDASSFPSGGLEGHLRSKGLYGLGLHFSGIPEGRGRCHHPLHPYRLLFLHRRGPGQEDPSASLHGGTFDPGD